MFQNRLAADERQQPDRSGGVVIEGGWFSLPLQGRFHYSGFAVRFPHLFSDKAKFLFPNAQACEKSSYCKRVSSESRIPKPAYHLGALRSRNAANPSLAASVVQPAAVAADPVANWISIDSPIISFNTRLLNRNASAEQLANS